MGQTHPNKDAVEITERTFQIDGYNIADRLLEGVMFDVTFDENGKVLNISVEDEAKEYFEQMNQKKFLKEVKEDAEYTIIEEDEVIISSVIKEKYGIKYAWIEVETDEPTQNKTQPLGVKMSKVSLSNILR